jgi:hypothetical protein
VDLYTDMDIKALDHEPLQPHHCAAQYLG